MLFCLPQLLHQSREFWRRKVKA